MKSLTKIVSALSILAITIVGTQNLKALTPDIDNGVFRISILDSTTESHVTGTVDILDSSDVVLQTVTLDGTGPVDVLLPLGSYTLRNKTVQTGYQTVTTDLAEDSEANTVSVVDFNVQPETSKTVFVTSLDKDGTPVKGQTLNYMKVQI